jgi:hypothetical protein
MLRAPLAAALVIALAATGAWAAGRSSAGTARTGIHPQHTATRSCGPTCLRAYDAIAKALPGDRGNVLARAILSTPGFDYPQLSRALHVPTQAEILALWRRS